ncbi:MAG: TIM-barrel domain-containing protein [Actinomycetota bacterium]|jgi:alpha-glucosidase
MSEQPVVGPVTDFAVRGNTVEISARPAKAQVVFLSDDTFRFWVAFGGKFVDETDMVVHGERHRAGVEPEVTDAGGYIQVATKALTLRIYKDRLRIGLYRPDGTTRIVEEKRPLAWDQQSGTTQYLTRGDTEQYFGGGMQNGRFTHRYKAIDIAVSYNWDDGGCPNSVPFYLSSAGYGVFRHTFAPGQYVFHDTVRTRHAERRFDAYYFVGTPKHVIDRYTELTGRPLMPPIYGLEMGDADCYCHNANRGERHTLDALQIADGYVEREIPLGWMLVNDGYGCGYEDLDQVAEGLKARHVTLGLWTSTGLADQAEEVRTGARVRKLDVAWVGPGYRFALDACRQAYEGIEQHSDGRGFVWTPEGWAGSQRYAVHWSGDQEGSWEYIRWQIPTYAGATMSGLAYTTGDVDGIHTGSGPTYTRDLQWKTFLPVVMTMSGWADTDKQPWRRGEPYTAINRRYIQLRERLLPYFYTYAALAHRDGVGMVRPLWLEYPDDPATLREEVKYEFLAGEAFLVAPVYDDRDVRDSIYLPAGTWFDYWTGERYRGPVRLHDHPAPLDRLPLFVKGGSIIPMWPEGTLSWETRHTGQLDLDVYPDGDSTFTLYEDDGVTRRYRDGEYSEQTFSVTTSGDEVRIAIGAIAGDYAGRPARRRYLLRVHRSDPPAVTVVETDPIPADTATTVTVR